MRSPKTLALSAAVLALAFFVLPKTVLAAPAGCDGAATVSQDPNTKIWTCQFSTSDLSTGGATVTTKTFNDDGTPAEVNGAATVTTDTLSGSVSKTDAKGNNVAVQQTCDWYNGYTFTGCLWIPAMSWLGSWFLTIGGGLLRLAGTLFDTLVYNVIVNFRGTLDGLGITTAINDGWTIFRDFTNILIIGIFVFIAISIILGLKEFGQKKLIANVLIIAVLINFSLLFTRIIIDGSNFVAYEIYSQMNGSTGTPQFDIAAAFLKPMGITSVWDDAKLVTDSVAQQTNSGMQAFLYGLVGGALLLAAALVLLYGCFLIATRAILFIFLMLTAALAFATYLIPSLSKGEYGWSAWWKALFNNAVFAPLLMLFLAVSLGIVSAAGNMQIGGKNAQASSLGSIITHPDQQLTGNNTGWTAILIYIIGIGLLFVSFKMASKFAGTISGFSFAGSLLSTPFAAALRGLAPIAQRSPIIGARGAMARSMELEDKIKTERLNAATTKDYTRVLDLMKKKDEADKKAKSSYNAFNTGIGQTIGKATFVPKSLLAQSKGAANYAENANKIATEAAKRGAAAVVSKGDAEAHARKEVEKERESQHMELKERHAANEELLKAAKQMEESARANAGTANTRRDQEKEIYEANKSKLELNQKLQSGALSEAEHQRSLREQDDRIKKANEKLAEVKSTENSIRDLHNVPAIEKMIENSSKELNRFQGEIQKEAAVRAKEIMAGSREVAEKIAMSEAEHHGDATVAELARRRVGGRIKNMPAIERIKLSKQVESEESTK